ncbi:MAG: hypothetical protein JKX93_03375 [Rhizobiaceae bacterium]|nr:hypothetical protein [Rhizobiaceae bacterium]
MIYLTEIAIAGVIILGLGGAGYVIHRMIKHVDKRIQLMIRASYQNTRDIRENIEIVDGVRIETRKALEHQRVLLSSLNQQIKNLESTVATEIELENPGITARRVKLSEAIAKKKGLLGNLDEYLENGIAQIVANDGFASTKKKPLAQKQPKAISQQREKKAARSNTGGVVTMSKLLKQEKQRASARDEKTEKITKLSSIFANRQRSAARASGGNVGVERVRKVSAG